MDMITTEIGFFGDIWADMIRHRISRPWRWGFLESWYKPDCVRKSGRRLGTLQI